MEKLNEVFVKIRRIFQNRRVTVIILVLVISLGFGGWRILGRKQVKIQYQTQKVESWRGAIKPSKMKMCF